MSRIGKKPISVPAGVKFVQDQTTLSVEGPRGKLSMEVPPDIEVTLEKESHYSQQNFRQQKGKILSWIGEDTSR